MADAPPQHGPQRRDGAERARAGGLVEQQHAGSRRRPRATPSAASSRSMKARRSASSRSDEKPAACTCPPPPPSRATRETSTSGRCERMLALKRGPSSSRGSRTSTATSTPRSARTCSMMPSENGSAAPAASKSERSRYVIASRPSRRRSSRESAIPSRRALATGTSSYTRPKISCGRTPSSTSRAASRSASPVTLEYEKRPVSVTSPTYSAWRTTSSSGAPRPSRKRRTITVQQGAAGSTTAAVP